MKRRAQRNNYFKSSNGYKECSFNQKPGIKPHGHQKTPGVSKDDIENWLAGSSLSAFQVTPQIAVGHVVVLCNDMVRKDGSWVAVGGQGPVSLKGESSGKIMAGEY